jgi:hypothetical protein
MSVRIHIDRLVLDGVDVAAGSHAALRAAVERELAHLVGQRGLAGEIAAGGTTPSLRAPQIEARAGTKPAQLGAAIAGSVAAAVGGRGR